MRWLQSAKHEREHPPQAYLIKTAKMPPGVIGRLVSHVRSRYYNFLRRLVAGGGPLRGSHATTARDYGIARFRLRLRSLKATLPAIRLRDMLRCLALLALLAAAQGRAVRLFNYLFWYTRYLKQCILLMILSNFCSTTAFVIQIDRACLGHLKYLFKVILKFLFWWFSRIGG